MTDDELDAIEARANGATPGPWRVDCEQSEYAVLAGHAPGCIVRHSRLLNADSNAEFIAHARADIPTLVAEVRRLRKIEAAARRLLGDVDIGCGCRSGLIPVCDTAECCLAEALR